MKPSLLPAPRTCRQSGGSLRLPKRCILGWAGPVDEPTQWALDLLVETLRTEANVSPLLSPDGEPGFVFLRALSRGREESYRISIRPDGVRVLGDGLPGLFYGLLTFAQLVRDAGNPLPCLEITDAPAFPHRGFYLDVTRGKVPTLDTLKDLADKLAVLKINQLQLYVEHVFDFRFDPAIGKGSDPLRARDLLELDRHCRARHIELVPSLACFGHMGGVLSLPQYRELAAVDWPAKNWKTASWLSRLRGATINPADPRARRLMEHMLGEFLPLFTSKLFNMCGDETYDLGKGRSAACAAGKGVDGLYVEWLSILRELAATHGKRLMFWGDVMLHYPQAIPRLPKDCVALDWGYSPTTPFDKVGKFLDAGLDAYVCPSTRGYRVVFNDVEESRANIAGYARVGARLGACGLLNTDWGDKGHFNMLACSLHGIACGAAMSWNPASDEGRAFDRAFSLHCFGDRSGEAARLFQLAGTTGFSGWPQLIKDPGTEEWPATAVERAHRLGDETLSWSNRFAALKPGPWVRKVELAHLALACEALHLNAEKIAIETSLRKSRGTLPPAARERCRRYARTMESFARRLAGLWLQVNRPSGLSELATVFRRAVRIAAGLSRTGRLTLPPLPALLRPPSGSAS